MNQVPATRQNARDLVRAIRVQLESLVFTPTEPTARDRAILAQLVVRS